MINYAGDEIVLNILIVLGMVAAFSCLISLIRMRVGHYIVDASRDDVIKRLMSALESEGAKKTKINIKKGIITTFGITKIIDIVLYVLEGDRVKYIVKDMQGTKASVDVIAYRACLSWRLHFTKEEWRKYGYTPELIETVVQKINNDIDE